MKTMTKKMMIKIMTMKTTEEVDIEIKGEAREIIEVEAAAIEVQEDIALMMKITTMKTITKRMIMIMTNKMKEEVWEE